MKMNILMNTYTLVQIQGNSVLHNLCSKLIIFFRYPLIDVYHSVEAFLAKVVHNIFNALYE